MAAADTRKLDYFRRKDAEPQLHESATGSFDYFRRKEPVWNSAEGTWIGAAARQSMMLLGVE